MSSLSMFSPRRTRRSQSYIPLRHGPDEAGDDDFQKFFVIFVVQIFSPLEAPLSLLSLRMRGSKGRSEKGITP